MCCQTQPPDVGERAARAAGRVLRAVAAVGARAQADGGVPGAGVPGARGVLVQLDAGAAPAAVPHPRRPARRRHAQGAHQGHSHT